MNNDHKASVMDKVTGAVDVLVGKMTGNEEKVREGREKQHPPSVVERERDKEDHPGISYTKSGAMRQTCIGPPPPGPSTETGTDTETDVPAAIDETASVHQHVNYAGPNLTAAPPQHYSPVANAKPNPESPGRERLGAYDLHGGFPTGAPSPGAKGAEVFDPFDRVDKGVGSADAQSGASGVGQAR